MRQTFKRVKGFTLIELVLVTLIVGIVAIVGSKIISVGYLSYMDSRNLSNADWQGRQALERMVRDIRATRSPSDITTIGAAALTFVNTSGDTVAYTLSGTSLMRQKNTNTSQVLADGIQSVAFTYYDRNSAVTAVAANVRFILITLNVIYNNTNFYISTAAYTRDLG